MKPTERINQRMEVLTGLIKWHEDEVAKLEDEYTYWGGRERGVIFGYKQELDHLEKLLKEVERNEYQRPSATA